MAETFLDRMISSLQELTVGMLILLGYNSVRTIEAHRNVGRVAQTIFVEVMSRMKYSAPHATAQTCCRTPTVGWLSGIFFFVFGVCADEA